MTSSDATSGDGNADEGAECFGEGSDYEARVGYRRPPKHTRWAKGYCPNPFGRPRKRASHRHILEQAAYRKVRYKGGGRSREITILEAITLIIRDKAAADNPRAASIYDRLLGVGTVDDETPAPKAVFFSPEKLTFEEWEKEAEAYRDRMDAEASSTSSFSRDTGAADAKD